MVPPIRVPVAMAVVAAATVSAVAAWCTLAGRKPWWRPATWRWVFGSAPPPLLATSFCSDVYYVFRHPSPSAAVEVELDVLRVSFNHLVYVGPALGAHNPTRAQLLSRAIFWSPPSCPYKRQWWTS